MTKTIAMINNKGGVGKTTVTAHVAYALATFHAKRVLMVDFDPQANLSASFGVYDNPEAGNTAHGKALAPLALSDTLHLIPSTIDLENTEESLTMQQNVYALQTALAPLASNYDFILIDCPPRLSMLPRNALYAASDVCMISDTGYFTQLGLANIIQFVENVRAERPQLTLSSVILSRYDSRRAASKEVREIFQREFGELYLDTPIRETAAIVEATAQQKTVFQHKKNSLASKDFKTLTQQFLNRYE
jgi:chromosome partitioning protein